MMISSANILVIVIAAITAWTFGAAYHTPLGKVWLAAPRPPHGRGVLLSIGTIVGGFGG